MQCFRNIQRSVKDKLLSQRSLKAPAETGRHFSGFTVCNYCVWAQWAEFLPWKGKIGAILGKAVWKMDWNRLKEGDFWRLKWAHSWKMENFLVIFMSRIVLPNTAPSQLLKWLEMSFESQHCWKVSSISRLSYLLRILTSHTVVNSKEKLKEHS